MRQRVHAGGGGELRRQFDGQFRIEDDKLRQKAWEKNDGAALRPKSSNYRAASDFAAGTGGCGNANATGETGPVFVGVEAAEFEVRPLHKEPAGFANVEGAAATKGNHEVAPGFTECFACVDNVL